MARDFSPEERLLRLIRSKTSKPAPTDIEKDKVVPRTEQPKQDFSSKPSGHRSPGVGGSVKILNLENLNLFLILLLVGLLIYFIPVFFKRQKSAIEDLGGKLKTKEKQTSQKEEEPKRLPFTYFSEQVGNRNIFAPLIKEEAQTQAPVEEGPKLEEVKGQLNLLGVVGGERPQAIIEDKKAQKTYFLNKGEQFEGIEVKDILENKVILIYKGQEFELVL